MSWVRYDDGFTGRPTWDGVSYEARWHYLALVEICCRQERFEGRVPRGLAERVSDVPDPAACIDELAATKWITVWPDEVVLPFIDEHIPPMSVRLNAERSKERMRRMRERKRLCRMGDHQLCDDPAKCGAA